MLRRPACGSHNSRHVGARAREAHRGGPRRRQGGPLRAGRAPPERLHGRDPSRPRGHQRRADRLCRGARRHGGPAHRGHRRRRADAGARVHRAPRASVESRHAGGAGASRPAARHHDDLRRHAHGLRAGRARGIRDGGGGPRPRSPQVLLVDPAPRPVAHRGRSAPLPRRRDPAHAGQSLGGRHGGGDALARRAGGAAGPARATGPGPRRRQAHRGTHRGRRRREARRPCRGRDQLGP